MKNQNNGNLNTQIESADIMHTSTYIWFLTLFLASSTTVGCDSNNQEGHVPEGDQQVVVFCTEKSAAVYSLPSQRQMYMQTINESSNVISGQ